VTVGTSSCELAARVIDVIGDPKSDAVMLPIQNTLVGQVAVAANRHLDPNAEHRLRRAVA
jgi:hypothetical protein